MSETRNVTFVSDDQTSFTVDISQYDTEGFCANYRLRRHKFEQFANDGCHEARLDWSKYVQSTDQFGGCNPVNGNFTAVVLPLCKPERLRLVAYILECRSVPRTKESGVVKLMRL
jgi:hypothetical protein